MTTTPATQALLPVTPDRRLKLTMPDGEVLHCEYPDSPVWAKSWSVWYPNIGRIGTTGEQDWEIVDRYSLTSLFEAFEREILASQSHPLPGDVGMLAFLRECVEEARSDHVGYHESNKPGEPDTSKYDAALHYLAALTPSALSSDWIASGIPDDAIEAGIEAWLAANVAMEAREHSANPEDMADWDEGMIVAAIFKAVSRAMPSASALSGDAGETSDIEGRLEGSTPPESEQDWDCVRALQTIRILRLRLAALPSHQGAGE